MKLKFLVTLFVAGASLSAMAQGYKDGIEYYKADRLENAEELLKRNLYNADTDKAASYFYLGQVSLVRYTVAQRKGENTASQYKNDALKYFQKGVEANPNYAFNYIGLGHIDLINGNNKAASDNFKQAEKLDKKDAGIYSGIARAYYDVNPTLYAKDIANRLKQGENLMYKRVTSANPQYEENDQDFYIFKGDIKSDEANGDAAIIGEACNEYETAVKVNPRAGEGYVKYADALFKLNPNASISQLRNLLKENPESALGQRELAEKLYQQGKLSEALAEYAKLMNNPNHFKRDEDRYLTLLFFNKKYDKGFDEASRIVASNGDQFTARRFKYIFANLLKNEQALPLAEELLKLKSDKNKFAAGDYSMIAETLMSNGRQEEAVALLKQGLKDYPNEYDLNKTLANLVYKTDSYTAVDAMNNYIEALLNSNQKVSGSDYFLLGQFATIAGSQAKDAGDEIKANSYYDTAVSASKQAEEIMSDANKYLPARMIGRVEFTRGNKEQAIEAFTRALDYIDKSGINDSNKAAYDELKQILNK